MTAIPALRERLDSTGCISTIAAMGTQTEIAQTIVAQKADYILSLKATHPTLYNQVKVWFETAQAKGFEGIQCSHDQSDRSGSFPWRQSRRLLN